jgi:hypothetical protein
MPKNYRPVTVLHTLFKCLETVCYQSPIPSLIAYSFVIYTRLWNADSNNDAIIYCKSKGSNVHVCSFHADGAFDAIPHNMLFR